MVPEPDGGAHHNPDGAAESLREVLRVALTELSAMTPEKLIDERYEKFRRMGNFFSEGQ
jgi:acetyl-CoA carboxylase carboxyl transferase subunit alpha